MTDTTQTPAVAYTDKDFASLRQAMLDLAAWRLPEWTDRSPGDLGMVMVDLFAYVADVVSYYQDRIASEAFMSTASERRSVMHLMRLLGYELSPPVAAAVDIDVTFAVPAPGAPTTVTIPTATGFLTAPDKSSATPAPPQRFEYLGP